MGGGLCGDLKAILISVNLQRNSSRVSPMPQNSAVLCRAGTTAVAPPTQDSPPPSACAAPAPPAAGC